MYNRLKSVWAYSIMYYRGIISSSEPHPLPPSCLSPTPSHYIGHSAATLEQAEEAVNKGASLITHLFNAMLPVSVCVYTISDYSCPYSFTTEIQGSLGC